MGEEDGAGEALVLCKGWMGKVSRHDAWLKVKARQISNREGSD